MKAVTTLRNKTFNNQLVNTFKALSKSMLKVYKKGGETEDCINRIQQEVIKLSHTKLDTPLLMRNISPLDRHVQEDNCHYVIRIINTESLNIALHIAPSGTALPVHSHPDSLNVLLVKTGKVEVQQFSKLGFDDQKKHITLTHNDCSVGLLRYFNQHGLQTTEPLNVFFSIRCKVAKPLFTPARIKLHNKLRMAWGFSLLMSPIYSCGFSDFMDYNIDKPITSVYQTELPVLLHHTNSDLSETVKQAHRIRSGSNDDGMLLQAFELYLKAAINKSAEAQYWLSIMYLKGMGVTDDDDEALHWVSASADQNYKPAKELLHHLLTYDEALDC